ncbi:protein BIG GRAIN 1-like B [Nicotiana sylvestris]|uniref:Uncharacterized protein LOC104237317 n=1 Tax=Nicotiana sylvestris TaxID=4096 RepID=A0A1U7XJF3_NICSY|nr:PREDICTED: uncharacterized protein LOC104237317 [Nicotiana sylvestris]
MEKEKSRKHYKNPSFSSTLLDEIYRSIDGYDQRKEVSKLPKETKKYSNKSNGVAKAKANNNNKSIEDEEIASFRRACLIEKWMEKKVKDKVLMTRKGPSSLPDLLDNDPLFFSSTSSSESNSGTLSTTSSEADCFYSEKSSRNTTTATATTCFAAAKSKKSVRRASVSPRLEHRSEFYLFDDYHNQKTEENEESLIKSKSRALKIYNNLKKVKQPISPGGRLTNFLSSIFNNGNGKKSKDLVNIERNAKSGQAASSTCSSASSFSRSCLSTKTPPNLTPKFQNGVKRTVRFNPVSVIVDEDCRPCGHKCIYDQESDNFQKLKSQGNAAIIEKNRKYEVTKVDSFKSYKQLKKKNDYIVDYKEEEEDFEDEDAASDSSSDLFEIDHLAFFGNNRFCEELPVYETTHLDTNRGIANRFVR